MTEPPPQRAGPPPDPLPSTGPLPETVRAAGATLSLINTADPDEYLDPCRWCGRGFGDGAPAYRHDDTYSVDYLHPGCVQAAEEQAQVIAHLRALRPMIDAFTRATATTGALTTDAIADTVIDADPAPSKTRPHTAEHVTRPTREVRAVAVAEEVVVLLPLLERAYAVHLDTDTYTDAEGCGEGGHGPDGGLT